MVSCLNPRGKHDNPDGTICCSLCGFLIMGAQIGIYEVIDFIGAGSFGHVYKVREPNPLSRILALKVLRLDQSNAKAQTSFSEEAHHIAAMRHTNILPIYNFGHIADRQQPYFVMEYAPRTIRELFRSATGGQRQAYVEELVVYIQQIAAALKYVHDNRLVHQDVKPGNLLIGYSGQILLADFGTAYYLGTQTHASLGEITGTAAYMPPEQWQGAPRRESDQYALAICCYELLTGRTPFVHARLEDMWKAQLKELPPPPQKWNARVPVEVSAVLQRALSKDHRQRYSNIIEFSEQYSQAVDTARRRYICQRCGQQNRTGAHRCAFCGADYDNRYCQYCDAQVRFAQRCCSRCGRLTLSPETLHASPLIGITVRQSRYTITRILKQTEETGIMTAVARDAQAGGQLVVLKRWECTDSPLTQRAKDVAYYDRATEPLAQLRHPLLPRILDRFAEGKHYYAVMSYIDSESLEERSAKLLHPLPEQEIISYLNSLLNILSALEQHQPAPIRHNDISPANILIEAQRQRVFLTGFQIPPPPPSREPLQQRGKRTTRKLVVSPYLPIQDKIYDQRSSIYALAASMHHALSNVVPHYPNYPPIRVLNPSISPTLERILVRALDEDRNRRFQSYKEMQQEVQRLL